MAIKALFFDVGNTLLFPNRARMLRALHERQVFPSEELMQRVERRTKREFDSLLESHAAVDHGFWHIYYSHLLDELGMPDTDICSELVACTRVSANWCDVRPGTREVLRRVGEKYRLGVISNADGRIADVLERCGIAGCFESITDSGIVGKEKPHPAIFDAAVRSLNVQPSESLYTGDVYSVDYLGATRAGMHAILFDVAGAYPDRGVPRVASLEELERQLGHL
ncbi:MAG TPA: HAD family hydrolase [Terriglobales bacterium]|nr:HAD family hydrolase [Terriglobales bacterium]